MEFTHTAPNCSTTTPAISALISTVTLSVSIRATTSSSLTAWPTWTVHSTIVPFQKAKQRGEEIHSNEEIRVRMNESIGVAKDARTH